MDRYDTGLLRTSHGGKSLDRIPGQDTCQENFAGSNEKKSAGAEEEKSQRDSAASASLGFLPPPLTFSFLLAAILLCFRSITLSSLLWNLINRKVEGTEVSPGDIRRRRATPKIVDHESRALLITSFHPVVAKRFSLFPRTIVYVQTNRRVCRALVYWHAQVCVPPLLSLSISFPLVLACIFPSVFPHADVRAQALLYLLGVLVSPLCRISTFTSIKPSEKYIRPPGVRFRSAEFRDGTTRGASRWCWGNDAVGRDAVYAEILSASRYYFVGTVDAPSPTRIVMNFYEKPFRGAQNNWVKKKKNARGHRWEKHRAIHAHRFVENVLF